MIRSKEQIIEKYVEPLYDFLLSEEEYPDLIKDISDIPDEVILCKNENNVFGFTLFAKYNGNWIANTGEKIFIKKLLEKVV